MNEKNNQILNICLKITMNYINKQTNDMIIKSGKFQKKIYVDMLIK
jgi:hypothetical protein